MTYRARISTAHTLCTQLNGDRCSVPFLQLTDTIYQIPACPCEEPLATEAGSRLQKTEDIGHAASEIPTRHLLVWRHMSHYDL